LLVFAIALLVFAGIFWYLLVFVGICYCVAGICWNLTGVCWYFDGIFQYLMVFAGI